jgi:peptidyl-prolyl cis-trans isomerase B (cyclophilin B)
MTTARRDAPGALATIDSMLKRTVALAACLSVLSLTACGSESDDAAGSAPSTSNAPEESESASTPPASGETVQCEYPADGQGAAKEVEPPSPEAPATGTVDLMVTTTACDIGITLDQEKAPCTVHSFVSLAEQGFYDDTPCPRIGNEPGFGILQCGDPTGTGSGGPGYSFADELAGDETYPAGTLAMANAGPDTNGSQFFFVFADSQFPPNYTVFGQIDEGGQAVLNEVAEAGHDGSNPAGGGKPNTEVTIESVTVG